MPNLKPTFQHIIWIFTESEGDGIEYKLTFKICATLLTSFSNIPEIDDFLIFQIKFQNYFDPIITCSVEQGGEFLSDTDTLLWSKAQRLLAALVTQKLFLPNKVIIHCFA